MERLSAIIITQDEERNIGRCLDSLQGVADEIVVVDSGSTDATETICRQAGARFERHEWEGYAAQKNYANSLASHPWILSIDADETLSPTLRNNLLQWKQQESQAALYRFNRLTNYCGHWIRHCGWYPDSVVRLFPAGSAQWDGLVHEKLTPHDPTLITHPFPGDILHYSYYSVEEHAARQLHYATLAAQKSYDAGKHVGKLGLWLRPGWTFIRNYILKLGFLDGHAGYTVCRMSSYYTFLKYSILFQLCARKRSTNPSPPINFE